MNIKEKAKELCTCHHKCHDTTDCVVEDEALLLINQDKSNNFDVKSNKQIGIFYDGVPKPKIDKVKLNWENRFQRWSNKQFREGMSGYGACGYGSMCDYCEDNSKGRPCVRSLNKMLRERRIVLDYDKATFEEVWDGKF